MSACKDQFWQIKNSIFLWVDMIEKENFKLGSSEVILSRKWGYNHFRDEPHTNGWAVKGANDDECM